MERIYFYKLTADNGGAPCVEDDLLSLAICKPMIRKTAKQGDVIFGFAANSLHTDNRLLYIARITDKLHKGEYYTSEQYFYRADCIYQWKSCRFVWRQGKYHHGPDDLVHDLGDRPAYARANVLLSEDFQYFGAEGSPKYKTDYPLIKIAVESLGRGYRVNHFERLRLELWALMREVWQNKMTTKFVGKPSGVPSRNICHRN